GRGRRRTRAHGHGRRYDLRHGDGAGGRRRRAGRRLGLSLAAPARGGGGASRSRVLPRPDHRSRCLLRRAGSRMSGSDENAPAPGRRGREPLRPPLPKRFYAAVTVGEAPGGWAILLDGRPVRTPRKLQLVVPTRALAEAIAEEWAAQGERVDPSTMPLS